MLPVLPNAARYQVCMQSSITGSSNFSNLQTGVTNMVSSWNQTASTVGGPTFQLQIGSTTSCQINIKTDPNLTTTGKWDFTTGTGGQITGGTISVKADQANTMSADVAKFLFTHELGHGVGLGDVDPASGCLQTDSIMVSPANSSQNFACSPTTCDKTAEQNNYAPPPPPPPPPCFTGDLSCPPGSPIILAVGPSADYRLTDANGGVLFDLDADGTLERMGWTLAGEPVGFLALDRNHNGIIDNGRELFGNFTPMGANQPATNGFDALAWFDRLENGGNANGWIDPGDAIWPSLRVWIDYNHDGFSQPEELFTLPDLNITAISTTAFSERRRDRFGNTFRLRGEFIINGRPRVCYDVFFVVAPR